MPVVTISPKYQVVIPKAIRDALSLKPGQKLQIIEVADRIELIPEKNIADMKGFLKGINIEFDREADRL